MRILGLRPALALAVLTAIVFGGTALAGQEQVRPGQDGVKPDKVLNAMGTVPTPDGGTAIFSLRAAQSGAQVSGNLKVWWNNSEEYFYNGAIRTMAISGNTITLSGGGGLFEDGDRSGVRFTATVLNGDPGSFNVTMRSRTESYTLGGDISLGFTDVRTPS